MQHAVALNFGASRSPSDPFLCSENMIGNSKNFCVRTFIFCIERRLLYCVQKLLPQLCERKEIVGLKCERFVLQRYCLIYQGPCVWLRGRLYVRHAPLEVVNLAHLLFNSLLLFLKLLSLIYKLPLPHQSLLNESLVGGL